MKPSLIIIGLGNPGASHDKTRHNAGFRAVDALSRAFGEGEWQEKQKFASLVQEARIVTVPVLLVKPQTYMNRSGEAVRKIVDFYKVDSAHHILIINDDIDIALGETRLRMNGGPGTHNGLRSVSATIGDGYPRLRIGIGPKPEGAVDLAAWVLSVPSAEDAAKLQDVIDGIPERIRSYVLTETPHEND